MIVTPTRAQVAGLVEAAVATTAMRRDAPAWARASFPMRRVLEWSERSPRLGAAWPVVLDTPALHGASPALAAFRAVAQRLATRLVRMLTAALLDHGAIAAAVLPR